MTHERKEAFRACMAITDWLAVYLPDINTKVETFNNWIQTALSVCMPKRWKEKTTLDKPWITETGPATMSVLLADMSKAGVGNLWHACHSWHAVA